jgi:RHS repeat-associated protein
MTGGAEEPQSNDPNNAQQGGNFAGLPSISLPKGGGAIRGMGEKFGANPVTGAGSMSIPVAVSPHGFAPQLSLSYDSGWGNGPFGFGWSLSLPAITRKTDKGLPRYWDGNGDAEASDVFILSGAEDLVPVLDVAGKVVPPDQPPGYRVDRYRPRIEGLFARIERWTDTATGMTHWRSISKDNVTTLYGAHPDSRIADPADPTRVFSWLICESYDDKGNAACYEYKAEDSVGIDAFALVNESNRTPESRSANRYLKRIKYGNATPRQPGGDLTQRTDWPFEVVFDYGEHYTEDAQGQPTSVFLDDAQRPWPARQDPFSSYRAGFEVRTYRLCRRVLMFHHFAQELGAPDYLVRATEFRYTGGPVASFVTAVIQSGFVLAAGASYLKKSLPPLEFEYSQAQVSSEVQEIDARSLENLPIGVDGQQYQWVDLNGEGVSGILTEQGDAWYYKPSLGDGRFGPLQVVASRPSMVDLRSGRQQLLDLAGSGQLDLVAFQGPTPGFFQRTEDEDWNPFVPFKSLPNLAWNDPNLRFVDLTGDGHADALITEDDAFTFYTSLAEDGFGPAEKTRQPFDEEQGPRLVFADGTQSIYLADFSGDGLADLVRIRNGEVCYWPNLGYGRFGAKVTMDRSPWFEAPDLFDQRRVRLADIDGSGSTDILYLGSDAVRLYFNHSGNAWSEAQPLAAFPGYDNLKSVQVCDLLGNGTACLVWSSPLPGDAGRAMRYVDLMGGQKPHLLLTTRNNLGAQTRVQYASSTKFYLADQAAGTPWITRLPFPVHVVERVEVRDALSRTRFATRYAYHHGYFDGIEREFRGFGMVEQWDTEAFAAFGADPPVNLDQATDLPPVLTRTWFHTGAYLKGARISLQFKGQYYREPGLGQDELDAMLLPDTVLPAGITLPDGTTTTSPLSADEEREAVRSLKGATLRQEIYALDGTPQELRPYSVSERNFTIRMLQPQGPNRHAVFFTHARETIDYHYERALYDVNGQQVTDPRVSHAMTLAVDGFGNPLQTVAIGYGRRHDASDPALQPADIAKQRQLLATLTESRYTNAIASTDTYRTPLPAETRTFELLKATPQAHLALTTNLFRFDEMQQLALDASDGQHDVPYEDLAASGAQGTGPYRRLIEQVRTVYRKDDLSGPLPMGEVQALALPYESYKLAFTPGLLRMLGAKISVADATSLLTGAQAQYRNLDGDGRLWIPSGRGFFSPDPAQPDPVFASKHRFLPQGGQDPFGNISRLAYDPYELFVALTTDALGNTVSAEFDYRVLQPKQVTDPNGNRSVVAFDVLGLLVGSAVMGKSAQPGAPVQGDSLQAFVADLTDSQIAAFAADPRGQAAALLGTATSRILYDVNRYAQTGEPAFAATIVRETHVAELSPGEPLKVQVNLTYSDGFGREIQKKIPAEAGPLDTGGPVIDSRWVGSGWTIFNNKGKPVRQYEPFFSATHDFEYAVQRGVSSTLFYDPATRVVATLRPNQTYEKVRFDPWWQESWDVNDTVTLDPAADPDVEAWFGRLDAKEYSPSWYALRTDPAKTALAAQRWPDSSLRAAETDAANKAAAHASTPSVAHLDALGRTFLTLADNGAAGRYPTRVEFDIEGNQRAVRDAIVQNGDVLGRIVMRYDYDMLGTKIHQASMEAGERWMLNDATGKPLRAWDSRGHVFSTEYDELHRPVRSFVQGTDPHQSDPRTVSPKPLLVAKTEYGEGQPNDQALNLCTRVFRQCDGAGIVTHLGVNPATHQDEAYDFKGNLLRSSRQLVEDYKAIPDWSAIQDMDQDVFESSSAFDALNRPVAVTAPDGSVTRPGYSVANLLESMQVNLQGAAAATTFVANIDYDAKGQRERIEYGNGATTTYEHDPQTFRLTRLRTTRPANLDALASQLFKSAGTVQDLHYTYDPAGNITRIADNALLTLFYNQQQVDPVGLYTYDALYRLVLAQGRENVGQSALLLNPPNGNYRDHPFAGLNAPLDAQAVRGYTEQYDYDAVGNFVHFIHKAENGNWQRDYGYQEASLIEPGKFSNRLSGSVLHPNGNQPVVETYPHDVHGNMTAMPHLAAMGWDFKDQFRSADLGGGGTAFYVYDGAGQRVRKVIERQNGTRQKERFYIGGYEVYREYDGAGDGITLERETSHVMDDKQRVALAETRTQGVESLPPQIIRYQFGNHLGSACLELDDEGQVISYEEYCPFGSASYQAGKSGAEVGLKRYRYTGKEVDGETGLNYYGARYYAEWMGAWISRDPIVNGRVNAFRNVRNNPITLVDPDGQDPRAPEEVARSDEEKRSESDAAAKRSEELAGAPVRTGTTRLYHANVSGSDSLLDQAMGMQPKHLELTPADPEELKAEVNKTMAEAVIVSFGQADQRSLAQGLADLMEANADIAEIEPENTNDPVLPASSVTKPSPDAISQQSFDDNPIFTPVSLPQRAKDVEAHVDAYLRSGVTDDDLAGVDRVMRGLTVGVAQPLEDPGLRVLTVTNPKVHDLFADGSISLAELQRPGEILILGPRPILRARKSIWHAEIGGVFSLHALGSEGGFAATSRNACTVRPGFLSCTKSFRGSANWVHMNPGD